MGAFDPDTEEYDLSALTCPKCGFNGVEVVAYPRGDAPRRDSHGKWTGRWFGSEGKAKCSLCNIIFPIHTETEGNDNGW